MLKTITTALVWMCFASTVVGQYITINDANFVTWLQQNHPSCMLGNQMDTTCTSITTAQTVDVSSKGLSSLWGIQYFDQLKTLYCWDNNLTFFPPVKCCIQEVQAQDNDIISMPANFPISLRRIDLSRNPITTLPALPANFQSLRVDSTNLSLGAIPPLPASLTTLDISRLNFSSLPPLPPNLISLSAYGNSIGTLPALPNTLFSLNVSQCNLSTLPSLPPNLNSLSAGGNSLTQLPPLPQGLFTLQVPFNQLACLPELPLSLVNIQTTGNQLTCVPNYLSALPSDLLALPLCKPNDPNNPNGCVSVEGISGYAYQDQNSDCQFTFADAGVQNVPLLLFDGNNNQIGSAVSASNGVYQFPAVAGNYRVELDLANAPLAFICPNPGLDSSVTVPAATPFVENVNFEVDCGPGFDVGAVSALPTGWVFPGQDHTLRVRAGDLSNFYNLNCAAGIVGQVTVNVTGPVTYNGPAPGALTPTASGLSFTYGPVDFDTVDAGTDFQLLFTTDTTAQAGDSICVDVTVTPTAGDIDPANNTLSLCYFVINSYDPNDKAVYPRAVAPLFDDWLTYTIRFQNTGTAPAFNIRLADTLSADLDWSTFQLLEMSHAAQVSLVDGILNFKFADILLPDSLSDPEGSQGYVQFRMKPVSGLPDGTNIGNRASIYFDFNPPIVTNTATTQFGAPVGRIDPVELVWLKAFPNPGNGPYTVSWEGPEGGAAALEMYNAVGQRLGAVTGFRRSARVDLTDQPAGVYFVRLHNDRGTFTLRLIKR